MEHKSSKRLEAFGLTILVKFITYFFNFLNSLAAEKLKLKVCVWQYFVSGS